jgi:hypothetical protein
VSPAERLRVLIANEKRTRLEILAQVVAGLGHEVIAREVDVQEVGAVTARERPDVALVGLGLSSEQPRQSPGSADQRQPPSWCGPGRAAVRNVTLARHIVTGAFVLVSERGWIVQLPEEVQDVHTTRVGNSRPAHW